MLENEYLALEGPVERLGNRLVFRVPLVAGGTKLREVARRNSYVDRDDLVVELPDWLATRMKLHEGTSVHIDNRWGKLNIARLQ